MPPPRSHSAASPRGRLGFLGDSSVNGKPLLLGASGRCPECGLSGGPATRSRSGSIKFAQRCGQPGQQQGLRFPSLRLEQPHSIRRVLVSAFLADSIQQIHSLRARGVMSSHVANAFALETSALFRSAGRSWTTPPEISFLLRASLMKLPCDWREARRSHRPKHQARRSN
jgi:hypothetical protein